MDNNIHINISNPVEIYRKEYSLLRSYYRESLNCFFLILIEDRRPDLKEYEYSGKYIFHGKYKTQICFQFFNFFKFNFIFRSQYIPSMYINDNDIFDV
jgi:hypothetical protein